MHSTTSEISDVIKYNKRKNEANIETKYLNDVDKLGLPGFQLN
jgi:hypothetical protein